MKKVIVIALITILASIGYVQTANAYSINLENQTPKEVTSGEKFNLTIEVDENTPLANSHIKYNTDLFEFVEANQSNMSAKAHINDGYVSWMYTDANSGVKNFTFTFKAKDVSKTSVGKFEVTDAIFISENEETYEGSDIKGKSSINVTIKAKETKPNKNNTTDNNNSIINSNKEQGRKDNTTTADKKLPQTGKSMMITYFLIAIGILAIALKIKNKKISKLFVFVFLPILASVVVTTNVFALKLADTDNYQAGLFDSLVNGEKVVAINPGKTYFTNTNLNLDMVQSIFSEENLTVEYIKDKEGNNLENTEKISTGDKVVLTDKSEYTVLLYGDADGNGIICNSADVSVIREEYVNEKKTEGVYRLAADLSPDNILNVKDVALIVKKYTNKQNGPLVTPFPDDDYELPKQKINDENVLKITAIDTTSNSAKVDINLNTIGLTAKDLTYEIYKITDGEEPVIQTKHTTLDFSELSHTFDELTENTEYYVIVTLNCDEADYYSEQTITTKNKTTNPDNPNNPDNPDNPDNPNNPDNPDNPDNPNNPDNPDNPNNPDNPDNPDNPNNPDNPDNPDNPTQPTERKIEAELTISNVKSSKARLEINLNDDQQLQEGDKIFFGSSDGAHGGQTQHESLICYLNNLKANTEYTLWAVIYDKDNNVLWKSENIKQKTSEIAFELVAEKDINNPKNQIKAIISSVNTNEFTFKEMKYDLRKVFDNNASLLVKTETFKELKNEFIISGTELEPGTKYNLTVTIYDEAGNYVQKTIEEITLDKNDDVDPDNPDEPEKREIKAQLNFKELTSSTAKLEIVLENEQQLRADDKIYFGSRYGQGGGQNISTSLQYEWDNLDAGSEYTFWATILDKDNNVLWKSDEIKKTIPNIEFDITARKDSNNPTKQIVAQISNVNTSEFTFGRMKYELRKVFDNNATLLVKTETFEELKNELIISGSEVEPGTKYNLIVSIYDELGNRSQKIVEGIVLDKEQTQEPDIPEKTYTASIEIDPLTITTTSMLASINVEPELDEECSVKWYITSENTEQITYESAELNLIYENLKSGNTYTIWAEIYNSENEKIATTNSISQYIDYPSITVDVYPTDSTIEVTAIPDSDDKFIIEKYTVEVFKINEDGTYTMVKTIENSELLDSKELLIEGLEQDTTYLVTVTAIDTGKNEISKSITTKTAKVSRKIEAELNVVDMSSSKVKLEINLKNGQQIETGEKIYFGMHDGSHGGQSQINKLTHEYNNLNAGTEYTFWACIYDKDNSLVWKSENIKRTIPNIEFKLTAAKDAENPKNQIIANISDVNTNDFEFGKIKYIVRKINFDSAGNAISWNTVLDETINEMANQIIIKQLTPGESYNIEVYIYDVAGNFAKKQVEQITLDKSEEPIEPDPEARKIEATLNIVDTTSNNVSLEIVLATGQSLEEGDKILFGMSDGSHGGSALSSSLTHEYKNLTRGKEYTFWAEIRDNENKLLWKSEEIKQTIQNIKFDLTASKDSNNPTAQIVAQISNVNTSEFTFGRIKYELRKVFDNNATLLVKTETFEELKNELIISGSEVEPGTKYNLIVSIYDELGNRSQKTVEGIVLDKEQTQEPDVPEKTYTASIEIDPLTITTTSMHANINIEPELEEEYLAKWYITSENVEQAYELSELDFMYENLKSGNTYTIWAEIYNSKNEKIATTNQISQYIDYPSISVNARLGETPESTVYVTAEPNSDDKFTIENYTVAISKLNSNSTYTEIQRKENVDLGYSKELLIKGLEQDTKYLITVIATDTGKNETIETTVIKTEKVRVLKGELNLTGREGNTATVHINVTEGEILETDQIKFYIAEQPKIMHDSDNLDYTFTLPESVNIYNLRAVVYDGKGKSYDITGVQTKVLEIVKVTATPKAENSISCSASISGPITVQDKIIAHIEGPDGYKSQKQILYPQTTCTFENLAGTTGYTVWYEILDRGMYKLAESEKIEATTERTLKGKVELVSQEDINAVCSAKVRINVTEGEIRETDKIQFYIEEQPDEKYDSTSIEYTFSLPTKANTYTLKAVVTQEDGKSYNMDSVQTRVLGYSDVEYKLKTSSSVNVQFKIDGSIKPTDKVIIICCNENSAVKEEEELVYEMTNINSTIVSHTFDFSNDVYKCYLGVGIEDAEGNCLRITTIGDMRYFARCQFSIEELDVNNNLVVCDLKTEYDTLLNEVSYIRYGWVEEGKVFDGSNMIEASPWDSYNEISFSNLPLDTPIRLMFWYYDADNQLIDSNSINVLLDSRQLDSGKIIKNVESAWNDEDLILHVNTKENIEKEYTYVYNVYVTGYGEGEIYTEKSDSNTCQIDLSQFKDGKGMKYIVYVCDKNGNVIDSSGSQGLVKLYNSNAFQMNVERNLENPSTTLDVDISKIDINNEFQVDIGLISIYKVDPTGWPVDNNHEDIVATLGKNSIDGLEPDTLYGIEANLYSDKRGQVILSSNVVSTAKESETGKDLQKIPNINLNSEYQEKSAEVTANIETDDSDIIDKYYYKLEKKDSLNNWQQVPVELPAYRREAIWDHRFNVAEKVQGNDVIWLESCVPEYTFENLEENTDYRITVKAKSMADKYSEESSYEFSTGKLKPEIVNVKEIDEDDYYKTISIEITEDTDMPIEYINYSLIPTDDRGETVRNEDIKCSEIKDNTINFSMDKRELYPNASYDMVVQLESDSGAMSDPYTININTDISWLEEPADIEARMLSTNSFVIDPIYSETEFKNSYYDITTTGYAIWKYKVDGVEHNCCSESLKSWDCYYSGCIEGYYTYQDLEFGKTYELWADVYDKDGRQVATSKRKRDDETGNIIEEGRIISEVAPLKIENVEVANRKANSLELKVALNKEDIDRTKKYLDDHNKILYSYDVVIQELNNNINPEVYKCTYKVENKYNYDADIINIEDLVTDNEEKVELTPDTEYFIKITALDWKNKGVYQPYVGGKLVKTRADKPEIKVEYEYDSIEKKALARLTVTNDTIINTDSNEKSVMKFKLYDEQGNLVNEDYTVKCKYTEKDADDGKQIYEYKTSELNDNMLYQWQISAVSVEGVESNIATRNFTAERKTDIDINIDLKNDETSDSQQYNTDININNKSDAIRVNKYDVYLISKAYRIEEDSNGEITYLRWSESDALYEKSFTKQDFVSDSLIDHINITDIKGLEENKKYYIIVKAHTSDDSVNTYYKLIDTNVIAKRTCNGEEKYFTNLQQAIDSIESDQTTITLLKNITENINLDNIKNKGIIIDGQNNKLNSETVTLSGKQGITIKNLDLSISVSRVSSDAALIIKEDDNGNRSNIIIDNLILSRGTLKIYGSDVNINNCSGGLGLYVNIGQSGSSNVEVNNAQGLNMGGLVESSMFTINNSSIGSLNNEISDSTLNINSSTVNEFERTDVKNSTVNITNSTVESYEARDDEYSVYNLYSGTTLSTMISPTGFETKITIKGTLNISGENIACAGLNISKSGVVNINGENIYIGNTIGNSGNLEINGKHITIGELHNQNQANILGEDINVKYICNNGGNLVFNASSSSINQIEMKTSTTATIIYGQGNGEEQGIKINRVDFLGSNLNIIGNVYIGDFYSEYINSECSLYSRDIWLAENGYQPEESDRVGVTLQNGIKQLRSSLYIYGGPHFIGYNGFSSSTSGWPFSVTGGYSEKHRGYIYLMNAPIIDWHGYIEDTMRIEGTYVDLSGEELDPKSYQIPWEY